MILPRKQLSISESYFGLGGFLLQKLSVPMSVEELWEYYKKAYSRKAIPDKIFF